MIFDCYETWLCVSGISVYILFDFSFIFCSLLFIVAHCVFFNDLCVGKAGQGGFCICWWKPLLAAGGEGVSS